MHYINLCFIYFTYLPTSKNFFLKRLILNLGLEFCGYGLGLKEETPADNTPKITVLGVKPVEKPAKNQHQT